MTESQKEVLPEEQDRIDGLRRREFLEILGASFATLGLAGCDFRAPKEKILPFHTKPEEVTPGLDTWYASTCGACPAACGILVKNRDGRPVKLEGNPEHVLTEGGLCARGQASILDLYDSQRLRGPKDHGKDADWKTVDAAILKELERLKDAGKEIRILSSTLTGPTWNQAVTEFTRAFPKTRTVIWDSLSASAILDAHESTHRSRILPWYRFDKARAIVSFDADFLGTWISPVEFTKNWSVNRKVTEKRKDMSWHAHFEPGFTITGASADQRQPMLPSEHEGAVFSLLRRVGDKLGSLEGKSMESASSISPKLDAALDQAAGILVENKGRGLVVSGSDNLNIQIAINYLNTILGNYGNTLNLEQPSLQYQGNDEAMNQLLAEMVEEKIGAIILVGSNPVYHHREGARFADALTKVPLKISLASRPDETSLLADYQCPDHHSLESWDDALPHVGLYSMFQPQIAPLFSTRSRIESLLTWAGRPRSAYDFQRQVWKEQLFPHQDSHDSFDAFWNQAVHDGVVPLHSEAPGASGFQLDSLKKIKRSDESPPKGEMELQTYSSIALGDGSQANNPWLQELPDPLGKTSWGNHASISPNTAKKLQVVEGSELRLTSGQRILHLPAHILPGLADNVVATALGYGRTAAGPVAANFPMEKMFPLEKEGLAGENLFPLRGTPTVKVEKTGKLRPLARTQGYDYQETPLLESNRNLAREVTLDQYREGLPEKKHEEYESLWPDHEHEGPKWEMAIDLNTCTGCSACVIGCQVENNVPVVGKAEVRKNRDMQWIRIDRYFSGSEDNPDPNPKASFLPMMCQHCDHAPCETVCPVLATVQSSEGLNVQVYNRCVGTRYCANNCPYKARRFNWFDYAHNDLIQNLVLNPDVTVRTRGVMEKCTFCVQRIQLAKAEARQQGRAVRDGEVQPACMQSCPSNAITFGNVQEESSAISKAKKDPRGYRVLDELGVRPAIHYLTKVRNQRNPS